MFLSVAVLLSLGAVDVMGLFVPGVPTPPSVPSLSSSLPVSSGTPTASRTPSSSSSMAPLPTPTCANYNHAPVNIENVVSALKFIAPNSTAEVCEDDPATPGQCRTARQAAAPLAASFERYCITSPAEKAALVSLIALESGQFKYQRNVFPGIPGQGTRNMQMIDFNRQYAASIYELKDLYDTVKDDDDAVLDLLLTSDEYDFGSAAWFLFSQCTSDIRKELQNGSQAGWENYLTECVGTEVAQERQEYMDRAKQVASWL